MTINKFLLDSKLITDDEWDEYKRLKVLEEEHRKINGKLRVEISNLEKENDELKADLQEANDSVKWWTNRFKAVQQELENKNNEISILKDELAWWQQECDDLQMQTGVDYE